MRVLHTEFWNLSPLDFLFLYFLFFSKKFAGISLSKKHKIFRRWSGENEVILVFYILTVFGPVGRKLVTKPNRAKFHRLWFCSNLISRWAITWEYLPTNLSSFGAANFFWDGMGDGISQSQSKLSQILSAPIWPKFNI
jgi:hypothetical protein